MTITNLDINSFINKHPLPVIFIIILQPFPPLFYIPYICNRDSRMANRHIFIDEPDPNFPYIYCKRDFSYSTKTS